MFHSNFIWAAPAVAPTPSPLSSQGVQQQQQQQQFGVPVCMGGLAEMVRDSILKCDKELQHDLWSNIVISGGVSTCPGQ